VVAQLEQWQANLAAIEEKILAYDEMVLTVNGTKT
jgi:hypothetical protein